MPMPPFHPLQHSLIIHNTHNTCAHGAGQTDDRQNESALFYMVANEFSASFGFVD